MKYSSKFDSSCDVISNRFLIHFCYIVGILLTIIIYLATQNLSQDTEAVSYISFAATLSSLILAILAIGLSFHSNNSLTSSLSKIDDSSSSLQTSSHSLSTSSSGLQKLQQEVSNTYSAINKSLADLGEKVDSSLSTVTEGVSKSSGDVKLLLEKLSGESLQVVVTPNALKSRTLDEVEFVSNLGAIELFVLAAMKNAECKSMEVDEKFFDSSSGLYTYEFYHGFFSAIRAMGYVSYCANKDIYLINIDKNVIDAQVKVETEKLYLKYTGDDDKSFQWEEVKRLFMHSYTFYGIDLNHK